MDLDLDEIALVVSVSGFRFFEVLQISGGGICLRNLANSSHIFYVLPFFFGILEIFCCRQSNVICVSIPYQCFLKI